MWLKRSLWFGTSMEERILEQPILLLQLKVICKLISTEVFFIGDCVLFIAEYIVSVILRSINKIVLRTI